MEVAFISTLDYEAAPPDTLRPSHQAKRWSGLGSCCCAGVALVTSGLSLVLAADMGREDIGMVLLGVLSTCTVSILGMYFGRSSLPTRRCDSAVVGLILNFILSLSPFALFILVGGAC